MVYNPVSVDSGSIELKNLIEIDGWALNDSKLSKTFLFINFTFAFSFMTAVALESEKRDHHPEWSNVYNRVEITWTTHSTKGLSNLDLEMAQICDKLGDPK